MYIGIRLCVSMQDTECIYVKGFVSVTQDTECIYCIRLLIISSLLYKKLSKMIFIVTKFRF